ncbi:MAG TPA: prephenate dehydratase [Terriglobia bacterium]|jgi:prephenate dehydratase|nr:prephenate dehydratase [Terriglobia bacterium]
MRLNATSEARTRIGFQGEPGAFSEEAVRDLLGGYARAVPCPTWDATFAALAAGSVDALLVPIENSLAGSVLRVYDLLLEHGLWIAAETIRNIEHHLIACPGASLDSIRSVESHPMALAQCERLLAAHPEWARIPAEDTAGSARHVVESGDPTRAAIAGRAAAELYGGEILLEDIRDDKRNFTRFVLLLPAREVVPGADKMTLAMRLVHRPGALLDALQPFARHGVNLLKIESRPIHGCPWEYQFFLDVGAERAQDLEKALDELRQGAEEVRVLGLYPAAPTLDCVEAQGGLQ